MIGTQHLLLLARAYAEAEGVPLSTVSSRVFDDGKKLSAIEAGGDIYSGRLTRAIQWFSENWPEKAVWPCNVPRSLGSASQSEAA